MKKIIRIFIIIAIIGNLMRPACAKLTSDSGRKPIFNTEFCNIDVSPPRLDYGDITRAMLENDSTISKRATVNVNCDKKRSGTIELKVNSDNPMFSSTTNPPVMIKIDKLTLDGRENNINIQYNEMITGSDGHSGQGIWPNNYQLFAFDSDGYNKKFTNLSAEITVELDLSSIVNSRDTIPLEGNVTFVFFESS